MKKFIIPFLFVSVIIGFFLSSCGTEKIIVVSPTTLSVEETITVPTTIETTTTERETTTTEIDLDAEFLSYVKDNTSLEYLLSDSQLIEFAQVVCNAFSNGMSSSQVIEIIFKAANGASLNQTQIMDLASLAGAGVATYCPEYAYKLSE